MERGRRATKRRRNTFYVKYTVVGIVKERHHYLEEHITVKHCEGGRANHRHTHTQAVIFFPRNDHEVLVCGLEEFYSRIIILRDFWFYSNALETCGNGLNQRHREKKTSLTRIHQGPEVVFLLPSLLCVHSFSSLRTFSRHFASYEKKPFKIAVAVKSLTADISLVTTSSYVPVIRSFVSEQTVLFKLLAFSFIRVSFERKRV